VIRLINLVLTQLLSYIHLGNTDVAEPHNFDAILAPALVKNCDAAPAATPGSDLFSSDSV
jgi:hypothetical protein